MEIVNVRKLSIKVMLSESSSVTFGHSLSDISDIPHVPIYRSKHREITSHVDRIYALEERIGKRLKWVASADRILRYYYVSQARKMARLERKFMALTRLRQRKRWIRWTYATKWRRFAKLLKVFEIRHRSNELLETLSNEIELELLRNWEVLVLANRARCKGEALEYLYRRRDIKKYWYMWRDQFVDIMDERDRLRQLWTRWARELMSDRLHLELENGYRRLFNIRRWEFIVHDALEEQARKERKRDRMKEKLRHLTLAYFQKVKKNRLLFSAKRLARRKAWQILSFKQRNARKLEILLAMAKSMERKRRLKGMIVSFIMQDKRVKFQAECDDLRQRQEIKRVKQNAHRLLLLWKENARFQSYAQSLRDDMFLDSFRVYKYRIRYNCPI